MDTTAATEAIRLRLRIDVYRLTETCASSVHTAGEFYIERIGGIGGCDAGAAWICITRRDPQRGKIGVMDYRVSWRCTAGGRRRRALWSAGTGDPGIADERKWCIGNAQGTELGYSGIPSLHHSLSSFQLRLQLKNPALYEPSRSSMPHIISLQLTLCRELYSGELLPVNITARPAETTSHRPGVSALIGAASKWVWQPMPPTRWPSRRRPVWRSGMPARSAETAR